MTTTGESTTFSSWIFFACAAGAIDVSAALMTAARSTGWMSSRILPDLIALTSSKSSINLVCARALRSMTSTPLATIAGSSPRCCSNWVHPKMTFSGVRKSCDSVSRISSFIQLSLSASARAVRSWSSAVLSLRSASCNSAVRSATRCSRSTSARRRSSISFSRAVSTSLNWRVPGIRSASGMSRHNSTAVTTDAAAVIALMKASSQ